jgi:hypothetical protein
LFIFVFQTFGFDFIEAFQGNLMTENIHRKLILEMVDQSAQKVMKLILKSKRQMQMDSIQRFACLTAVNSPNFYVKTTDAPLLRSVDPSIYFPMLNIQPGTIPKNPRKFKMA